MGCGSSIPSPPSPQAFLADAHNPPKEGYLLDGWPRSIKVTGWSFCGETHAVEERLHSLGPMGVAGLMISAEDMARSEEPGFTMNENMVCGGVGALETLTICNLDDTKLASLHMPKHLSFGCGAALKDAAGNVVALLCTGESQRAQGLESSSYNIFGKRPQYEEQGATEGWYLWRVVKVVPKDASVQVFNARGSAMCKGFTYPGNVSGGLGAQKWKCETGGQGTMLCLPTKESPNRHHIQCAEGVDVALQVCIMYAAKLAADEVYKGPPGEQPPSI